MAIVAGSVIIVAVILFFGLAISGHGPFDGQLRDHPSMSEAADPPKDPPEGVGCDCCGKAPGGQRHSGRTVRAGCQSAEISPLAPFSTGAKARRSSTPRSEVSTATLYRVLYAGLRRC
jgi:hypothetical protein